MKTCGGTFKAVIFLFVLIFAQVAFGFKPTDLKSRVVSDENRQYTFVEFTNQLGEYEVQIRLKEQRWFAPETERLMVVGRSLNGLKKIDTWFIPGVNTLMEAIQYEQGTEDPWEAARTIINHFFLVENRWYSTVLFENIGPMVSMAVANNLEMFERLKVDVINLLDLEVRADRVALMNPDSVHLSIMREVIKNGWEDVHKKIREERTRDFWLYYAGDVALYVTGAKVVALAGKATGKGLHALSKTEVAGKAKDLYVSFAGKVAEKTSSVTNVFKKTSLKSVQTGASSALVQTGAKYQIMKLAVHERVTTTITFIESQGFIARTVLNGIEEVSKTVGAGFKQLPYILQTQAIQVGVEFASRYDKVYDPDPIVLTKSFVSNQDFIHNFLYMTNETFWLSAIASRQQNSLAKGVAIGGLVALGSSTSINLLWRGTTDYGRLGLDTGWEMVFGNLQTHLDMRSIMFFSQLAQNTGHKSVRLLGYLVALVDQSAGYYGYAKVTDWYQEKKDSKSIPMEKAVRLIPIVSAENLVP